MNTKESDEDIARIDKENMLKDLEDFHEQIKEGYKLGDIKLDIEGEIKNIVVLGMGGSALPGVILQSYLTDLKIPLIVIRDYTIPPLVTKDSLVIAISYSGNTEEPINAYREAWRKGVNTLAVTSGGKLEIIAKEKQTPLIKVPKGLQPRAAFGYMTLAIIRVLENLRLIKDQKPLVDKTAATLKKTSLFRERAEELAEKLVDKVPLIYSSTKMLAVAYKWKISFNENAKVHAFCNVFPELNHNEMEGYEHLKADYHLIIIQDEEDHPRIRKRMDILKKLVKKKGVDVTEINISGRNPLTKLFSAIYIGDWTAFYLAINYKQDPSPVNMIEDFKKELK